MQPLWDTHRGRCYQKVISFSMIVQLIADALLQYSGSGRRSFEKSKEQGELTASVQAAYRKLGRLPVELSEAFLSDSAVTLREMFPRHARRKLPRSLRRFQLVTLDGKTIKNVARRVLKLRGVSGGLLGGRALVALEWSTGAYQDLVLVTDLLDHEEYPAQDLLTVYAERWGISHTCPTPRPCV